MAIKVPDSPSSEIAKFWPDFRKTSAVLFFVVQLFLFVIFLVIISFLEILTPEEPFFWLSLVGFCSISFGLHFFIIHLLGRQIKKICDTLIYISGENTRAKTPAVNQSGLFESASLRTILGFLYNKDASANETQALDITEYQLDKHILEKSPISHVALDERGKIIFASKNSPIRLADRDEKMLDIIFEDEQDSLMHWLKNTARDRVRATKTWVRISNRIIGEEDRRIFDMIASYEKNTDAAQTILVFIDRTDDYIPEEEDLDFIAFAAHELRGPITVIRGYIDVLQDEISDKIDPEQAQLFSRLEVSANRLSGYINNILNASRYDRRHLRVRLREEKIDEIYETIADDMQLRASAQQRFLHVAIPKDLPKVAADAGSISEVIANLVDNAIKYSNEGGIINISARAVGDFVQFDVQDFGIGMPANIVSNLFKKFYRSHRSRETVAGTGIGLYISKAFVESHGGIVEVRSVEGEGSTFSFTLPIYETVADRLQDGDNQTLIESSSGWIRNHSMYRG